MKNFCEQRHGVKPGCPDNTVNAAQRSYSVFSSRKMIMRKLDTFIFLPLLGFLEKDRYFKSIGKNTVFKTSIKILNWNLIVWENVDCFKWPYKHRLLVWRHQPDVLSAQDFQIIWRVTFVYWYCRHTFVLLASKAAWPLMCGQI